MGGRSRRDRHGWRAEGVDEPRSARHRSGLPGPATRAVPAALALAALALAATACGPELPPRTEVSDLRILAIKAEPPEVVPGQATTVSALVVDPYGGDRALDWALTLCTPDPVTGACLEYEAILETYPNPDIAQTYFQQCCLRAGTDASEQGALELGGRLSSAVVSSRSMLEGLDERDAQEGVNAQLTLVICVSGVCTASSETPDDSSTGSITLNLPPDLSSVALKRFRVSSSEARNHNPELERVEIDGVTYRTGQEIDVVAGQSYQLIPRLSDESIETYSYIREDGTTEQRTESPYFSWYATAGEFDDDFTEPLDGSDASNLWTAPSPDDVLNPWIKIYVVVWDRRGGIDWLYFTAILGD